MKLSLQQFAQYFSLAIAAVAFFLTAAPAAAQVVVNDGPLSVSFAQLPLFSVASDGVVAPGDTLTQDFTVTSSSVELESLLLSATNTVSSLLSDQTIVTVTDNQTQAVYFEGSATEWFGDSPLALGLISPGVPRDFVITLYFATSSGNTYQGTSFGFDLAVGFQSGATVTVPGGGGSGGGGGGSFVPTPGTPNPTTPAGLIAGASDSAVPAWWQPVVRAVTSAVAGIDTFLGSVASAESSEEETDDSATPTTPESDVAGVSDSVPTVVLGDLIDCTLWWVWLLALLSFLAITVEYIKQPKHAVARRLFGYHVLGLLVFAGSAFAFYVLSWLEGVLVPAMFVVAWALLYIANSRLHATQIGHWEPRWRSVLLVSGSVVLIILSLVTGWPCVWWPFTISAAVAVLVFFWYE